MGLLLHKELLPRSVPLLLRDDRGCFYRDCPFSVFFVSQFNRCHLISPFFSASDRLAISFTLSFLRDRFAAKTVRPPTEVALATIIPKLAKQNGHIASPLVRVAKRDR
jgi:hypothetical protein